VVAVDRDSPLAPDRENVLFTNEVVNMHRNIVLAAALPAPPDRLFDMYLDAGAHSAFTGAPVTIEPRAGAPFSAFDGILSGTILHVAPGRQIVQTWRSNHWAEDLIDSVLVLSFWPEAKGEGLIELAHINVPGSDFAGVSQGWDKVLLDSVASPSEGRVERLSV
jgi:activator of HSP90 ATPase